MFFSQSFRLRPHHPDSLLLGQHGKHYRPTTNFCQDSYKQDSCEKCCRMAARIDGTNIKEESIIAFKMVLERQPLCVCCSPNTAFPNEHYVCTIQAHYGLLGQHGKHYRPTTNFCQDSYKQDSCEKCCRMAARIDGTNIKEESIIGFKMVLERQPLCVCCSPNTAY